MLIPTSAIDVAPTIAHFSYGAAVDQRSFGDMVSDKDLQLRIKQELMHLRAKDGFFLNVYAYEGRVFLIGDPPSDFQEPAVRFALQEEGVKSLDYCFFPPDSGSFFGDFAASCSLRLNLLFEPGISSSWVETEVYAGQAVLLGIVSDLEASEKIVETARTTIGIHRVINFLLVEGEAYTPPPDSEIILRSM
ncbi:MAG: BON domain-containing protein [Desulfovibrionaceae bacterium]|nr:BON domain-containing protein [Desulfovibrionaceae bacterium]